MTFFSLRFPLDFESYFLLCTVQHLGMSVLRPCQVKFRLTMTSSLFFQQAGSPRPELGRSVGYSPVAALKEPSQKHSKRRGLFWFLIPSYG